MIREMSNPHPSYFFMFVIRDSASIFIKTHNYNINWFNIFELTINTNINTNNQQIY